MHYEIEYALGAQANGETGSIRTEAESPAEAVGLALEQLRARGISRSEVFRIAIKKTGRHGPARTSEAATGGSIT